MSATLHSEILAALEGTSSQRPLSTLSIIKKTHRQRRRVEAELEALYQARLVFCCKIIKPSSEWIVWWRAGSVPKQTEFYGKKHEPKSPAAKTVRRISAMSVEVRDTIYANPGMTMPELVEKMNKPRAMHDKIRNSVVSLFNSKTIRKEGTKQHYRYYPGVQA